MKYHISGFVLLLASTFSAYAQLATTNGVSIHASVSNTLVPGVSVYSYEIANPASNAAAVVAISLDISQPAGTLGLSGSGLQNGTGFLADLSNEVLQLPNTVPMVPVGVELPLGWIAFLTAYGKIDWVSSTGYVAPGAMVAGFQVTSPGLPGLRKLTAEPYNDVAQIKVTPPNGDPTDMRRYVQQLDAFEAALATTVDIVGPVAPPAVFRGADFLKTIQGYETTAMRSGWIKNAGLLNSLDQKLSGALAAMQRGDNATARNVLGAFINEVNAQTDKGLSPEAVALFKYNAQYLIANLP